MNSSLKRAKYGHPKSWLKQQGREDCAKSILVLQKVANCAKHGPGNSCKELYRMRPDLFPRVSTEKEATENRLVIDGVELDKLFDAARKAAG
ncbi:hypothetical protein CO731_01512 [Aminobacter sp. MSH1]|nr:hypothetical protein CO731_01512 [Aminobacter sp. MSH1]